MDYEVIFKKNGSEKPTDWSLQEFSVAAKSIKREVFLDRFPQHFLIEDLTYHWGMSDKVSRFVVDYDKKTNDNLQNSIKHEGWERLEGNLTSARGTAYSMFGADRIVEDFKLFITPGNQFEYTLSAFDNAIQLYITLMQNDFSQIVEKLQSGLIEKGYLSFVANGGLYSEDAFFDYDPDIIKVLTQEFAKNCLQIENEDEKPSVLGDVRNLEYSFSSRMSSAKARSPHSLDYCWVNEKVDMVIRSDAEYYKEFDSGSDEEQTSILNEELEKKLIYSPMAKLLKEMLFEARACYVQKKITIEQLEELSKEIIDLVESMANAFQEDSWHDYKDNADALSEFYQRKWALWRHTHINFHKIIKGEKRKFVEIIDLKNLVSRFLRLPIRSPQFSRILIDAMIYHETAAFAETLLYASPLEKSIGGVEHKILLRGHPLWRFFKSHLMTFIVLAVLPIGGFWLAADKFDVREEWTFWMAIGCVGLFTLNFALGVISLPHAWISEAKEKKRVTKLLEEMTAIYSHIGSGEIISARFVWKKLENTTNDGAVWTPEIFPLLDDVMKRDGFI